MWLSLRRAGRAAVVIIVVLCAAAGGRAWGEPGALEPPLLLIVESALWRAHHDGDLAGLQDLAAPEARLDGPALLAAFARQRSRLLPADQIACEEVGRHGGQQGEQAAEEAQPDSIGREGGSGAAVLGREGGSGAAVLGREGSSGPAVLGREGGSGPAVLGREGGSGPAVVELRCALQCRRGDYAVRVLLAPPQPLVLRAPRPALLLGLWLEPPVTETAGGDGPWWPLGGLPLLAVLAWWRLRRAPGYHG